MQRVLSRVALPYFGRKLFQLSSNARMCPSVDGLSHTAVISMYCNTLTHVRILLHVNTCSHVDMRVDHANIWMRLCSVYIATHSFSPLSEVHALLMTYWLQIRKLLTTSATC